MNQEATKYARKCDITGEGMNAGFVYMDDKYFKYKKDLIAEIRSRGDEEFNKASDEFILNEAYNCEEYYYTEWEDESEFQYIEINGEVIEIEEHEENMKAIDVDNLEFVEGDGVEYEVYKNPKTGKLYKVQIEIVRHFEEAEEVESLHAAKFGG